MDFSVIICTYNRSHNLAACLSRLACQRSVEGLAWEVLVVDNNSDDGTEQVVADLAGKLPISIRYAREAQQGLNYARNTGIGETESRYFAYVDDDILVSESWLASLYETFIKHDADAVGGRIHLDQSIKLPGWVEHNPEMKGFLGFQDYGDEPFRMDGLKRHPYGGNMAFNRRVVNKIGYFNPRLGRKGSGWKRSELFKGAETDYFNRLSGTGDARIFYEPRAIVYHQILPFQLKKKYFRTIHYNAGYQRAFYDQREFTLTILGVPRFYYLQLAKGMAKYFAGVISQGPNRAFRQQMTVGHLIGTMLGYHKRRLER